MDASLASQTALTDFLNDGSHYDALHDKLSEDVEFWVRRAHRCGGTMFELSCGTGRISIPMANSGIPVVGIDSSEAFLQHAARKVAGRDVKVTWRQGDFRSFSLGERFSLVTFPFRSVSVLLSGGELNFCFGCVRRHLQQEGLFILDAFKPFSVPPLANSSSFAYLGPNQNGMIEVQCQKAYDVQSRVQTATFQFSPSGHRRELKLCLHTTEQLVDTLEA